jgi:hypothetical protein
MKSIKIITFLLAFFLISELFSQTGNFFTLRGVIHKNTAGSTVNPISAKADSRGGFLEVEVLYYGNCREKYRFEFQFDEDMSSLEAGKSYGFSYSVQLISPQCNTNRNSSIRPIAPLGASSGLIGGSGFDDIVNAIGVKGWAKTYAKDLGRPNVYKTTKMRGVFQPIKHKLNAHTWLAFSLSANSNLPGESFVYEFLYAYQIVNDVPVETISCPPPDCSGFPGTVPVWNFNTNKGECWCPEGMRWDKMQNKCVPIE